MKLLHCIRDYYAAIAGKILFPDASRVFTHLTVQEKYILNRLAKHVVKRGGKNFLEIGSYLGASSIVIASALTDVSQKLYCVDTWENDAMTEGKKDTFHEFSTNVSNFSTHIVPLRGVSAEISQTFNESLDYIFFDGDHSYEGIKTDVITWLPKLRPGGIAIFHDYGWADGVISVVHDLIVPRAEHSASLPNMFWATLK